MKIPPSDDKYSMVVIMKKLVEQKDFKLWSCLKNMHLGTVIDDDLVLLTSRMERSIESYGKARFKYELQVMSQWRLIVPTTVK